MSAAAVQVPESKQQRYNKLRQALKTERATFEPHWRDIASFIKPRRLRLNRSDVNRGDKRNQNIIDSTATQAAQTLRAGLLSGMTSPARPWFRLSTGDSDLAKFGPVRDWLDQVREIETSALRKSNFYHAVPLLYGDMGVFGTGCMGMMEDDEEVFRFHPFPLGEYWVANDAKGRVRTFVREFRMTVRQLVMRFGRKVNGNADWSNFSPTVRSLWEKGNTEAWVDVCHVIEENTEFNALYFYSKFKRFSDCYYECGAPTNDYGADRFLEEKGFDEFPSLCARWEVSAGDVYGTDCPGMTALADAKQLQFGEKVGASALDKMVRPPMIGPTALMAHKVSQIAGEISYFDEQQGAQIRPLFDTSTFRVDYLEKKQEQVRERINDAFFVDLLRLVSTMDPKDVTATAITEMKEEKFLLLGPVFGQAEQDLLKPTIDRAFNMLFRRGMLPPPPPELHGQVLTVEYTSVMAEAQKALARTGVDVFTGFALKVAEVAPDSLDKIDTDQLIETYADMTSIPPKIIRSQDDVDALRQQRAKAAEAQQNAEAMAKGSVAARNLSAADLGGNNALRALMAGGPPSAAVPVSTGAGLVPGGV